MITLIDGSTLEAGIESFGNAQCFYKRQDIRRVDIPVGVKTIRKGSFRDCSNLECVSIPSGVTTIEPEAFCRCRLLKHVSLPESIKVIGSRAFAESGLVEMELTPRIRQMGRDAFQDCRDLGRFVVPEGYKADSFGVYRDKVAEMTVPPSLEHLCEYAPRDEWYYRLKNKNLDELERRMREDRFPGVYPAMITVSSVLEDLEFYDPPLGSHHFVSPKVGGPYFGPGEAYDGLCGLLRCSMDCREPGDIALLAANLVDEYAEEGFPNPNDTFDLSDRRFQYAICFHPLPGLSPGKPVYAVVADLWHSASFHPFTLLFGFARTKTIARQTYPMRSSYSGYPYSQDKPEIIELGRLMEEDQG